MNCICNLKLKTGFDITMSSEFLSKPVNLSKILPESYSFYNAFFPEAFEKNCNCSGTKSKIQKEFIPKSHGKK